MGTIDAAADEQSSCMVDAEVIARCFPSLRSVPERGAEVRLVRRLVLGESRVTVEPEHRLFCVHRPKLGIESGDAKSKIGDQLLEFLPQDIVGGLVPDEPWAVVVASQALQEFDQGGDVHRDAGSVMVRCGHANRRCTTSRPSAAARFGGADLRIVVRPPAPDRGDRTIDSRVVKPPRTSPRRS